MKRRGFTLTELIIAAGIASILAGLTATSYVSIQRLVARGEKDLVAAQTARVIIDRISRDLRQAIRITDTVAPDAASGTSSLLFEDGHDVSPDGPTYIAYSLEDSSVRRNRHYYYMESNPTQRLPYNAGVVGQSGFSVTSLEGENYIIADNVDNLLFYGEARLVQIDSVIAVAAGVTQNYHSAVAKRNQ